MRTKENIAAVSARVNGDHQLEIRCRSQQLGLCYATTWKILRKDLNVNPFKIQLVQFLVNGLFESWPTPLSQNYVQRRNSFLAQWIRK